MPKTALVVRVDSYIAKIEFAELFVPTVAGFECSFGLGSCRFDIEQAFVQSDLEDNAYMRLPQGCGRMSGKLVRLDKKYVGF